MGGRREGGKQQNTSAGCASPNFLTLGAKYSMLSLHEKDTALLW